MVGGGVGTVAGVQPVTPDSVTIDDLDRAHHETLAALRSLRPVVWVPAIGGWVVLTREAATQVMRDASTFTVDDPRFSTAQVVGPSMLSLDGDEHDRHRAPFAAGMRPSVSGPRLAARVDEVVRDIVDAIAPNAVAEMRREVAGPVAVGVVAAALGLDAVEPATLLGWYDAIVAGVDTVSRGGQIGDETRVAVDELGGCIDRAAHEPGTLACAAAAELSAVETRSNSAVFMFGGIETSEGMTTSALRHVLTTPGAVDTLRADPALVDDAVEESLRLEPAAARVDRYATCDVSLGGSNIERGDLVVVSLAAANRDPVAYEDPDRFVLGRSNARTHVAFARGPHACVGAQLARMETRAVLRAVLERLPEIRVRDAPDARGTVFRKPPVLWVEWDRER